MARRARPAIIGGFVLGAVGLLVTAIVIWGGGRLFRDSSNAVAYFDGSVNGLSVGAPVKFRGVQIGWVRDIRIRYRQTPDDRRVPVLIALEEKRLRELDAGPGTAPEVLHRLVAEGLHARLESQSLVSGTFYIELRISPQSAAKPSQEDEIPTLPNQLQEASGSLLVLLERLKNVDFEGMGRSIAGAADSLRGLAGSPELRTAIAQMPAVLRSIRRVTAHLDAEVQPTAGELRAAVRDARETLARVRTTLDGADRLIAPDGPLAASLSESLDGFDRAARAVRELAESLDRNPSALIVGRKDR